MEAHRQHADGIFRFALSKTSDRQVAFDLMQETFTRAWDYLRSGGTIQSWKPFLFKTAYNLIVDTYRKPKHDSLEELAEDGFEPSDADAADLIIDQADASLVRQKFDSLSENDRVILTLRFVEGLTAADISSILGTTENATAVRIHRATHRLKAAVMARNTQGI